MNCRSGSSGPSRLQRFWRTVFSVVIPALIRPVLTPRFSVPMQRRLVGLATSIARLPGDVTREQLDLGSVPAERHSLRAGGAGALLYLHGGGYCIGAARGYRSVAAWLCHHTGRDVYVPDYRLAPEHPFPAAIDDALAVYRALLNQGHERIVVAGDSAGGGLALALTQMLRQRGLPAPVGQVLFSPWVDLHPQLAACMSEEAHSEHLLTVAGLRRWSRAYLGDAVDPRDPLCSPLYADMSGMPPTLIQGGGEELMHEEFHLLHQRMLDAGVRSELQVEAGLWHVFQVQAGMLYESDQALQRVAEFLREHC